MKTLEKGACEVSVVSWLTRYCNFVTSLTEVHVMAKFSRDQVSFLPR